MEAYFYGLLLTISLAKSWGYLVCTCIYQNKSVNLGVVQKPKNNNIEEM